MIKHRFYLETEMGSNDIDESKPPLKELALPGAINPRPAGTFEARACLVYVRHREDHKRTVGQAIRIDGTLYGVLWAEPVIDGDQFYMLVCVFPVQA